METPPTTSNGESHTDYTSLKTIGRGAFGSVIEARSLRNGERVALKRVPIRDDKRIALVSIREISTMRQCTHPNIVNIIHVFVDGRSLVLVLEIMECDLNVLFRSLQEPLPRGISKAYLRMILLATNYMHSRDLIHRDIKPSNIMISSTGVVKLGDFGLARVLPTSGSLTPQVSTRWYRSPEVLFGSKTYGFAVDMWSVGCVFAELLTLEPVFPGDNDIDQISRIFRALGTPNTKTWPGFESLPDAGKVEFTSCCGARKEEVDCWTRYRFPDVSYEGRDLLSKLLRLSPNERLSASTALLNRYFFINPLPMKNKDLPKFVDVEEKQI